MEGMQPSTAVTERKSKSDAEKIASALQSGPKFVTRNATLLDWPLSPAGSFGFSGLVGTRGAVFRVFLEPTMMSQAALTAWVHAEWVRIHAFANGNGRTARLWSNSPAMRYGLPPFVCLRPRPNTGYGGAGAKAMHGNWETTARVFRRLLDKLLREIDFYVK